MVHAVVEDARPSVQTGVDAIAPAPRLAPRVATTVRASRTVDWGGEGVLEWSCTEQRDAFSADRPVSVSMEVELRRVCGAAVYDELAAYCRARQRTSERRTPTLLPMMPQQPRCRAGPPERRREQSHLARRLNREGRPMSSGGWARRKCC
jgi:hypothetical protein